ncbi:VCBS repeat-containing protein [Streptomyces sp. NPDC058301]|uniref:VCBS repeat-containing protein n=1 Tax=Streptomyces sp. NPDC058301 TaxID=3346436 RepID=UPI0036E6B046
MSAAATDAAADSGLPEEEQALAAAQASGQPAEVVSARTESSDEWANPDGSFSVKRYGSPIRVFRDGAWVAADPTLVFAADGSVVPKASTVSVVFSGGGDGLLLKGIRDGRTLTLGWPRTLPKPTLAENVATYANVLPDVDMQLKAEVDGFSQLLVVKTAEAAKNPELETVKYSLQAAGLAVSKDADTGVISAVDPAGQAVFSSPPPVMWDSTTLSSDGGQVKTGLTAPASATGSGFDQPAGAKSSLMPSSLSSSTLSIVPDQTLLGASDTKYPVYIDPLWSGSSYSERQHWTRVYKKWPTNSYYDAKDVARVGFEHETDGVSRSFFQLDTAKLKGAKVVQSTFRIKNVWSWSCQARPVQLWETGPISRKTNWNNQPGRIGSTPLKTVDESKGWSSSSCPAGNLEFDVTPKMKTVADQGKASITLGLSATAEDERGDQPEEDTFSWKKFDPKTAVLETKFNRVPERPDGLGTFPYTSCQAGSSVGNTHISLYARVRQDDAGPLHAHFSVTRAGESQPFLQKTVDAANWSVATLPVADADLPTGSYTWNVTAADNQQAESKPSPTCTFSVDRDRPTYPPLIKSTEFPNGTVGWDRAHTGQAKDLGCFTFDPNTVKDVDSIWWWTDTNPSPQKATAGACQAGVVSAPIRPPGEGPHFVYAYSVDAAGNRSNPASYLYYANTRGERDQPGDLNGDGNNDLWSVDSNGTLLTHTGQGNGQFSAAASGGKSFSNTEITYRGGWRQNSATDLVSLEYDPAQKRKRLWMYSNDGDGMLEQSGLGEAALGRELSVACPEVDETLECYTADDHWKDADQIVAAGDLNRDKVTELLVKEGKLLYLYYGDTSLDLSSQGGPRRRRRHRLGQVHGHRTGRHQRRRAPRPVAAGHRHRRPVRLLRPAHGGSAVRQAEARPVQVGQPRSPVLGKDRFRIHHVPLPRPELHRRRHGRQGRQEQSGTRPVGAPGRQHHGRLGRQALR